MSCGVSEILSRLSNDKRNMRKIEHVVWIQIYSKIKCFPSIKRITKLWKERMIGQTAVSP